MKLQHSLLAIIIVSVFSSAPVQSGCDPCIKAAAEKAATDMVTRIEQVSKSVSANEQATKALNQSLQAVNASLQATINLNTQQQLQGLSASTDRIELSVQQNTKTVERMADYTVKSMVKALRDVHVAEAVDKNNKTYSDQLAQPLSGEIGANRAPLLKQGLVQSAQTWRQMANDMHKWSNDTGDVDSSGKGIKKAVLLAEGDDVWNPTPLLTKRQISSDESINMQKLLTMLVNPVPLPAATDEQLASSSRASEYEFERRIINAKLGLAHAVMAKGIADKQALIPISADDWQKGYVMATPDAEGKVSIMSMLESETVGRLGSEGWYQDVKTKTPAGILREQVYQQAVSNHMLLRSAEREEQELLMLALLAISELEESRPVLK